MSNVVVLGTSDSIVAVLAAAPTTTQPAFSSSWVDTTASTTSSNKGTLNGTSEVTIVAAPGSDQRQVDFMRIYNSDTALATLTVSIANGANRYPIGKWVLAIGSFIDVLVTPSGALSNNDRLSNLANPESIISAAATASTAQWNRCYATSAAYALTLPPVLASAGKIVGVRIDSSSTYNVTVTGNGTDSIDGNNTFFMVPREVAEFKSDGVSWQRLSSNSVDGNWTPVLTTFTLTGSPVITARYKKTGNLVWINIVIQCTSGNTFASVNNSSRLTCPFTQSIPSVANFLDNAANTSYGVGSISSSAVWFPAITATSTSQIIVTGTYSLN